MNASHLRELVVVALKGATDAGDKVFSPRDWPTTAAIYPALLVQTPLDVKTAQGRNTPSFTTITTVRITGRVQEHDSETEDDGALKAELALENLREQVERAVINSYELTRRIQKFAQVRSTIDIDASGEGHIGQLLMELDLEHFQGPEDFYPVATHPLEGIDITVKMPDGTRQPGVSINTQE